MKRVPSLHITEPELAIVIKGILDEDKSLSKNPPALAKLILQRAKSRSPLKRTLILSDELVEKKLKKVSSSPMMDALLFRKYLSITRITDYHHHSFKKIAEDSPLWPTLKNIVQNANLFCERFNLDKKEGYRDYIALALNNMPKSFALPKFLGVHDKIMLSYECKQEIDRDSRSKATKEAHDYYVRELAQKTGIHEPFTNHPDKYIFFVKVSELCSQMGIGVSQYIQAQVESLAWTGNYPHPGQLIGDNAKRRFIQYAYKNNINLKKKPVDSKKTRELGKRIQRLTQQAFKVFNYDND